jgi:hypothetical protein
MTRGVPPNVPHTAPKPAARWQLLSFCRARPAESAVLREPLAGSMIHRGNPD